MEEVWILELHWRDMPDGIKAHWATEGVYTTAQKCLDKFKEILTTDLGKLYLQGYEYKRWDVK